MEAARMLIVLAILMGCEAQPAHDVHLMQVNPIRKAGATHIEAVDHKALEALWNQLGQDIDDEARGKLSGFSVSLNSNGDRVVIGAEWLGGGAQYIRVFGLSGNTWSQLGQDIDGEAAHDQIGRSVSMSSDGNRVAIGAHRNDGAGPNAGHVRVFGFSSNTWSQLGQDIDGEAAYDGSGVSVSLSGDGNCVAVGAYGNDGAGSNAGHVRVFGLSGNTWSQLGQDIDGEAAEDWSGNTVSLSRDGNRVAIGAHGNDGAGFNAGHVRVFGFSSNTWSQLGQDIDGEAAEDWSGGLGLSLSGDGNRVAVGANGNDGAGSNAGHVRVFGLSGNTWSQLGQDIDGEAADDGSGRLGVSLSDDGNRVAIGAFRNDGAGSNAGHVRVFGFSSNTWSQLGQDIDGESAGDHSGWEVSLSGDGNRVAISAPRNDGAARDGGHVRVFEFTSTPTTSPTQAPTPSASPAPSPAPASIPAMAKGDPHLTNVLGQHFDIMKPGIHLFAQIPKGAVEEHILLQVSAEVKRLSAECTAMFIQSVNITGLWVMETHGQSIHHRVRNAQEESPWQTFHEVCIKVVRGHMKSGVQYLNVVVKGLAKVKYEVGGLLGTDDFADAATPDVSCKRARFSMLARSATIIG